MRKIIYLRHPFVITGVLGGDIGAESPWSIDRNAFRGLFDGGALRLRIRRSSTLAVGVLPLYRAAGFSVDCSMPVSREPNLARQEGPFP